LRSGARGLWRRITPRERSLVVGDGELGGQIERKLTLFNDMHLEPVGRISASALDADVAERGHTHLDTLMDDIDRVIIASGMLRTETIAAFSVICRERQVKLSVVSTLRGRATPTPRITQVADLPVFEFNTWDVSRSTMVLKRIFDLVGSTFALLLSAPVLPLIALAIKLDSRGPVFFTQERAGIGGRPFRIIKFRTMDASAEERLHEVVRLDELEEPMFKLKSDPRVTRVGRFLRRTSLDELPQLLNVLRGQMSIVGPRPEQLELVARYRAEDRVRLDVKPGMTGPMQVSGRGSLTFAERLAVEADYIENLSLARDLRLLALTASVVLRRKGAY
jgi:exopolysaccharide biosynthesis polyprenyl glycosylphosphotransferase